MALILCGVFISCEQEIGRLDMKKNAMAEINFDLKKDREVKIWTDMDIEYKDKPLFVYDFEFYEGKEFLLKGGTDPLVTTNNKNEVLTDNNGVKHWKFYGKLDGNFIPKKDGTYTFKVTFIKNSNPDLKINKAEIVFIK